MRRMCLVASVLITMCWATGSASAFWPWHGRRAQPDCGCVTIPARVIYVEEAPAPAPVPAPLPRGGCCDPTSGKIPSATAARLSEVGTSIDGLKTRTTRLIGEPIPRPMQEE